MLIPGGYTSFQELSPWAIWQGVRDHFGGYVMAALNAYFDDSHSDLVVSVAGYVGTTNQWANLEKTLNEVFKEFGKPYLHMREFTVSAGPYSGWKGDEQTRALFIQGITEAISGSGVSGVCAVIPTEELRYCAALLKHPLGPTYSFCLAFCFMELHNFFGAHLIECQLDTPPPAYVTDAGAALSCAEGYVEHDPQYRDWWQRDLLVRRFKNIHIPTSAVPAFQVADFAAWESRERVTKVQGLSTKSVEQQRGRHWSGERMSLVALSKATPCQGRIWNCDGLLEVFRRWGW